MCDNNNLGYVLNRNKPCTKCGQEVNETIGYRYCHRCGTIFMLVVNHIVSVHNAIVR